MVFMASIHEVVLAAIRTRATVPTAAVAKSKGKPEVFLYNRPCLDTVGWHLVNGNWRAIKYGEVPGALSTNL